MFFPLSDFFCQCFYPWHNYNYFLTGVHWYTPLNDMSCADEKREVLFAGVMIVKGMPGILDIFLGGCMVLDFRLESLLGDVSEGIAYLALLETAENSV